MLLGVCCALKSQGSDSAHENGSNRKNQELCQEEERQKGFA